MLRAPSFARSSRVFTPPPNVRVVKPRARSRIFERMRSDLAHLTLAGLLKETYPFPFR